MLRQTLLLLLAAMALCLAACKTEPDLLGDHVPLVNLFIGVWVTEAGEYWQFRTDGTGGRAGSEEGPFPDEFSFLSWKDTGITDNKKYPAGLNTLLLVSRSENSPQDVKVKPYTYTEGGDTVSAQDSEGNQLIFTRVEGKPAPLDVSPHLLLGQWEAQWDGGNHDGAIGTWSFLYRSDGTVKTYHHGLHQFEIAYTLLGNTLVIFGEWRFRIVPVIAEISQLEDGTLQVIETLLNPAPDRWAYAEWIYTKVKAAKWK